MYVLDPESLKIPSVSVIVPSLDLSAAMEVKRVAVTGDSVELPCTAVTQAQNITR